MERVNYDSFFEMVKRTKLAPWADSIRDSLFAAFDTKRNGNLQRWYDALRQLPAPEELTLHLKDGRIAIGEALLFEKQKVELQQHLEAFMPWRKGPWEFQGVHVDTEWHSDWKWERVVPHLSPLEGRKVLDIGSGNGYYAYRMVMEGAKYVIGLDPGMLSVVQYLLMKSYTPSAPLWVLPLGIESMPDQLPYFDTVFSMGVLYHRKSPIDHIMHMKNLLRPGGELVLETIVVDDSFGNVLVPEDRYAKMRNVWFIPSVYMLETWLRRCGLKEIQTVDVSTTSIAEQRRTEWSRNVESLQDFLSEDLLTTVEGYPAPKRAVLIAKK